MDLPRIAQASASSVACLLLFACTAQRASGAGAAARGSAEAGGLCPAGYVRYTGLDAPTAIGASARAVIDRIGAQRSFALSVRCEAAEPCQWPDRKIEIALRYAGAALCSGRDCSEVYPETASSSLGADELARCPKALLAVTKLRLATDAGTIVHEFDARVVARSANGAHVDAHARISAGTELEAALGAGGAVDLDLELRLDAGHQSGVLELTSVRLDRETDLVHGTRLASLTWPATAAGP